MHLITRMSLKNRLIVGLLTLVIAVFGIVATTSLKIGRASCRERV